MTGLVLAVGNPLFLRVFLDQSALVKTFQDKALLHDESSWSAVDLREPILLKGVSLLLTRWCDDDFEDVQHTTFLYDGMTNYDV